MLLKVPEMPVTVTVEVPIAAVALVATVSVVEAESGLELKDAVTPLGSPDAEKVTLPVKPFRGVTVMALKPEVP